MESQLTIKDRIHGRLAHLQNGEGKNADALNSLVDTLATELFHLRVEQEQSEQRVLRDLQRKLRPENSGRKRPAHNIFQRYPEQGETQINPEEYFEIQNSEGKTIFFSPLFPMTLFPMKIKYRWWNEKLWEQESLEKLKPWTPFSFEESNAPNEIWIAIESEKEIPPQFFLYLNAAEKIGAYEWSELIPHLKIEIDGAICEASVASLGEKLPSEEVEDWKERY